MKILKLKEFLQLPAGTIFSCKTESSVDIFGLYKLKEMNKDILSYVVLAPRRKICKIGECFEVEVSSWEIISGLELYVYEPEELETLISVLKQGEEW